MGLLPPSPDHVVQRLWFFFAVVLITAVVTAGALLIRSRTTRDLPAPPEKYDELQFVMVHRPHVTYFVDTQYMLCFATLKPEYRDLAPFECSDALLKDVEVKLQGRATKKGAKP